MILVSRAPAKVNLVLRVGPRRADGYHDLATLMVPLDLADEVEVQVFPGRAGELTCECPGHPALEGPDNLAARAARALMLRLGRRDRCHIVVRKRIPVVAGLGGGSSDAAAALRCLARAYHLADRAALAEVALSVGSDVPFFLGRGPAWAAGRGERLEPARVAPLDLVLLYPRDPALAIRAGDAYRFLDEDREAGRAPAPRGLERGTGSPSGFDAAALHNDLQGPCFGRHTPLAALAARLEGAGARPAIMSGSGPTIFGLFAGRAEARRASRGLGERGAVEVFVVRTLQRLPGVSPWKSRTSASSRSTRTSSRRT
ncbi:4-(cytidine 5'-diphospho)-2-C-methyl-D-erythritol kinase [Anaeromyxobacter paludicola]|uniref:4-diphosphocytidyl-2-C-methyl-D-erythritol kinase n=1 Tax=Anaeromyxobacter paludicola TaxID=2918171 RepID=A0ABN6NB18_9BACT|nr:4-(cytidine 5'-diphospho)-2-C-methyl-D-erythritol kinase [Anaeromyxobacter paludicola]BDG09284.1 4-diphosphocytidyl-2-C-methyl-D-erythritol kinase [Anaeromyxobacter paludicola]